MPVADNAPPLIEHVQPIKKYQEGPAEKEQDEARILSGRLTALRKDVDDQEAALIAARGHSASVAGKIREAEAAHERKMEAWSQNIAKREAELSAWGERLKANDQANQTAAQANRSEKSSLEVERHRIEAEKKDMAKAKEEHQSKMRSQQITCSILRKREDQLRDGITEKEARIDELAVAIADGEMTRESTQAELAEEVKATKEYVAGERALLEHDKAAVAADKAVIAKREAAVAEDESRVQDKYATLQAAIAEWREKGVTLE